MWWSGARAAVVIRGVLLVRWGLYTTDTRQLGSPGRAPALVTPSSRGRMRTVGSEPEHLPDWERLLAAERHLQHLVPGAVLVGGTAAALHGSHRVSMDGDHVLADLGQLDGILTGIRQLRRTRPLDTEEIAGLRVQTLAEMARIKAWLLATRHTVRDYLDTVVLLERLGEAGAAEAFAPFDDIYRQLGGSSALTEVAERLAAGS